MDPETIRKIRDALGLTQEEFAAEVGVTSVTISRWELGKATPSRLAIRRLRQLAAQTGVPYPQKKAA